MVQILYFRMFEGEVYGVKRVFLPSVLDVITYVRCHLSRTTTHTSSQPCTLLTVAQASARPGLRCFIWSLGPTRPVFQQSPGLPGPVPARRQETFPAQDSCVVYQLHTVPFGLSFK